MFECVQNKEVRSAYLHVMLRRVCGCKLDVLAKPSVEVSGEIFHHPRCMSCRGRHQHRD